MSGRVNPVNLENNPDRSKVLSVVPIFKNIGEQSTAEDYCPVSLLSVVGEALATEMWPFL